MAFDPSQFGATPVAPTPPGFNPAQFDATPATAATPAAPPSLAQSVWSGLAGAGSAVLNTAKGGISNVESGASSLLTPPQISTPDVEAAAKGGGIGAGALDLGAQDAEAGVGRVADLGKIVGGIVQTVLSPLFAGTSAIGTPIGKAIASVIPASWGQALNTLLSKNPEIGQNASDDLNIANLAIPDATDAAAPAISAAKDAGKAVINTAQDAFNTSPEEDAANAKATADAHVNATAKDWEAPSRFAGAVYNKARVVLAKTPDVPTVLAKAGVNPADAVEGGKYNTLDVAENLRATADKISQDVIRPSLVKADKEGVAPTTATDLTDSAKLAVKTFPDVTPDAEAKINTLIGTKIAALDAKYPDGMTLADMQDEKITYFNNSGYSQFKSNADSNEALANKAIGVTLKDAIEANIPANAPIRAANSYLSKLYSASDYLESLNNRKAPQSFFQRVAPKAAGFATAVASRHLFPGAGDLISSFAGYQIGKALENTIENMTHAGRAEALSNLKLTNPTAVTQLQAYLGSAPK